MELKSFSISDLESVLQHLSGLLADNSFSEVYSLGKLIMQSIDTFRQLPLQQEFMLLLNALPQIISIIESHNYKSAVDLIQKILQSIQPKAA